jgi:hypothetical protein
VEPHSLAEEEEEAATITQMITEIAGETTKTPVEVVAVVEVIDLFLPCSARLYYNQHL